MCLVELWLWKKAAVGCELWESCCRLWAVEKLKAIWLNKYKIYILSLSILKQLWKSFLFHQFRKAESQKPKIGSTQLSKMNYEKAAASEKAPSKDSLFDWAFDFWGQKAKSKAQPNRALIATTAAAAVLISECACNLLHCTACCTRPSSISVLLGAGGITEDYWKDPMEI